MMAKLICAYCKKIICGKYNTKDDSHGCCEKCLKIELKKIDEYFKSLKETT